MKGYQTKIEISNYHNGGARYFYYDPRTSKIFEGTGVLGVVHSTKLRGLLRENHLCLVLVSGISYRLEVWVLECSPKGQKRIENGMGK